MSKVITISRSFLSYHPKAGQPTHFVEKIYESLYPDGWEEHFDLFIRTINPQLSDARLDPFRDSLSNEKGFRPKKHTIRTGERFKAGEMASLRVWSAEPYNSKQIILAPDVKIVRTMKFEINPARYILEGREYDGEIESHFELLEEIAANDGLDRHDLQYWLRISKKPFSGQIIFWEDVNYEEVYERILNPFSHDV